MIGMIFFPTSKRMIRLSDVFRWFIFLSVFKLSTFRAIALKLRNVLTDGLFFTTTHCVFLIQQETTAERTVAGLKILEGLIL